MPKAGIEIGADLKLLRKEMAEANRLFRELNKNAIAAATGLKPVEVAAENAGKKVSLLQTSFVKLTASFTLANIFNRALSWFRGIAVESVRLAINLEGVQRRAEAIFGNALPGLNQQLVVLSQRLRRS